MQEKYLIPERIYEKYNTETCFQIKFTEAGLEILRQKYRKIKGLPAFIHNLMRGRQTHERTLFFERSDLFSWAPDCSALTIPNKGNIEHIKKNPHTAKDDRNEGLALVSWAIDSRLLKKYGWENETGIDRMQSFLKFLHQNNNTKNMPSGYSFFERTVSQEEIGKIESMDNRTYLATILDLTAADLPFLKMLREMNIKLLKDTYGVDFQKDLVDMYFHFPTLESTTTLHLHIRVNQFRHPMEKIRIFSLDDVMHCLGQNRKICDLVLGKETHYCNNLDILHDIEGVDLIQINNPFKLNSPVVTYNDNDSRNPVYDWAVDKVVTKNNFC